MVQKQLNLKNLSQNGDFLS